MSYLPIHRVGYWVAGTPIPQGSKRAWYNQQTKQVMMTEDAGARHTTWRHELSGQARQAMADAGYIEPFRQPIHIGLHFKLHRGLGHYGSGRNTEKLKPSAPPFPIKPPDIDKLTRAVLDSLTSIVWVDDSQVVRMTCTKAWVDRWEEEGVAVYVSTYEGTNG